MASGCACAPVLAGPCLRPGAGRDARASASDGRGSAVRQMLPAAARMRRRADFASATRRGRRAGRPLVSGHLLVQPDKGDPALVGFVVSRKVGAAVVRNRVKRRLRHLARCYLESLPRGSLLVLRASPSAATA